MPFGASVAPDYPSGCHQTERVIIVQVPDLHLQETTTQVASQCLSFIQVIPKQGTKGHLSEVKFTEIKPPHTRCNCLVVFVDTFSEWAIAFKTQREAGLITVKTFT